MPLDRTLHHSTHETCPKHVIKAAVGPLEHEGVSLSLSGHQVLVGMYVRPERTAGGLLRHDTERREDEWQGKVGLILAMAPLAFSELGPAWADEKTPRIGDWVGFRVMDGVSWSINGHMCRIFEDKQIRAILPHPDFIV